MGCRIIKQPNGKWGIWSTFDDRIHAIDCSEEELIEFWAKRSAASARYEMKLWLENIKEGQSTFKKPMTLDEALEKHQFIPKDLNLAIKMRNEDELQFDEELLELFPDKAKRKEEEQ